MDIIDYGIQKYSDWLMAQPNVLRDERTGWSVVSTEELGLFNDNLEIYFMEDGERVNLSDNGDVVANLEMAGTDTDSKVFRKVLNEAECKWGVRISADGEIVKRVGNDEFGQGKHDLLSAMVFVCDMAKRVNDMRETKFIEDVDTLMRNKKFNAINDVSVYGESGYRFTFDYMLARPSVEYVIQPFIRMDLPNLSRFAFGIEDVKILRERIYGKQLKGMVILNDVDCHVDEELLRALNAHQLDFVLWSKHEESEALKHIVA